MNNEDTANRLRQVASRLREVAEELDRAADRLEETQKEDGKQL